MATVDRRTVLKVMAASLALGGLTACSRPEEEIIPYVSMPEYLVPGVPLHYATIIGHTGLARGVIVESLEGRPVKIEGNPDHPASLGASDSLMQAELLTLYDPDRSAAPLHLGQPAGPGHAEAALAAIRDRLEDRAGAGVCLLTGAISSPTALGELSALRRRHPGLRWYRHEPGASDAAERGAEMLYGRALTPRYHFGKAARVVALDADFLGTPPDNLLYARQWAQRRRPWQPGEGLARLYVAEPTPTITGAKADHRLPVGAGTIAPLTRALARRLGLPVDREPPYPRHQAWADAAAEDLRAHGMHTLVIAGPWQPPAVHALAMAMNHRLGNVGHTVSLQEPVMPMADGDLGDLATAMAAGEVSDLVILDANPVYTAPAELEFAARLANVERTVHLGLYADETAGACHWHLPLAHALESWGDGRAPGGTASVQQPLIRPLHGGWSVIEILARLGGRLAPGAYDRVRAYWRGHYTGADFEGYWRRALQRGTLPDTASRAQAVSPRAQWHRHLPPPSPPAQKGLELTLRPDPAVWDGRHANNAWLQELPRPLSKLTWGNAVAVSPADARRLGVDSGSLIELASGGSTLRVPVWVQPGQAEGTLSLTLGYGRRRAGRVGNAVGVDGYRLLHADGSRRIGAVTVRPLGTRVVLASTQRHHRMHGRHPVRAADLATYRADPNFVHRHSEVPADSLYPEPVPPSPHRQTSEPDYAWAMVIDLSACIGCNACITACQAENNIPVVGKEEVARGREMHWIRLDRYYEGPLDDPTVRFQPVPCMHCENAPCEYVCPVEATQHSHEGLNEMIYNRCIGTRYCSQNCPYKVRRFNWLSYTGDDSLQTPEPARNPEVTVRVRGVMEKCTYCVQRINRARIAAKNANSAIPDGGVRTACQQACPTEAIRFGDQGDPRTEVARLKREPLNYGLLADLNTRPRTTYLAEIRHANPRLNGAEGDGER